MPTTTHRAAPFSSTSQELLAAAGFADADEIARMFIRRSQAEESGQLLRSKIVLFGSDSRVTVIAHVGMYGGAHGARVCEAQNTFTESSVPEALRRLGMEARPDACVCR